MLIADITIAFKNWLWIEYNIPLMSFMKFPKGEREEYHIIYRKELNKPKGKNMEPTINQEIDQVAQKMADSIEEIASFDPKDPKVFLEKEGIVETCNEKEHGVIEPSHYQGKIEAITIISMLELDFCRSNALKYIWRSGKKVYSGMSEKESEITDLDKAIRYLEMRKNYLTLNHDDILSGKSKL